MMNLIQPSHRPASLRENYSLPVESIMELAMEIGGWWCETKIPLSGAPNGLQISPPEEEQEFAAAPYHETRWTLLSKRDYMALELGWPEAPGGDHPEGCARGAGRALVGGGPPGVPLRYFFVPEFYINSTKNPLEVSWQTENFYFCTKTTPW
jgi:hypothetical protein